jgi:hypothetical protein
MTEEKTVGEVTPASATGKKKIKKKEAVRRALKKLGPDASNKDIQDHVKKRFHLEMSTNHISTTKGELRKEASKTKPTEKLESSTPVAAQPARSAAANGKSKAVAMEDVLTLRSLVNRVGADHLRTLIDVMSR